MAYTTHPYTKLNLSVWTKKIDVTADTFKAIALSAYTIGGTRDSAQFASAILTAGVGTEAAGGTYPAGGVTLTTVAFTLDSANHQYVFSCDPIVFSTSGISVSHVLIVDTTPGSNATNPLVEYWDLGGTQTLLSITPDPTGLLIAKCL